MRGDVFARQLKLLTLLEVRREGVELEEAAEELGAQRRTVYRDFRVLEDAGIPLTSARDGRRARWRLMEGFRHRLQLSLTWSELVALMSARQAVSGLAGTLLSDGAASAVEKIRATLPKGLADRFRAWEPLVSAQQGGRDYGARGEMVKRLVEAVDERRTIAARYRSRAKGGRSDAERKLDPYHLRVAEDGIYLLARCHRSGEVKSFLVDRFDAVVPTEERFTLPGGFSAEKLLRASFAMWSGGRTRRVRFTVAPHLADLLMERKVHPSQAAQRRSDGSVEVRLEVAVGPPLIAYLTGLGAGVSEIQPRDLREAVLREHRRALEGLEARVSRRDTGAA